MSFYTVFDRETVVTSTTTSVLQATDPILVASSQQKHAVQSTVGQVATLGTVTAVTTLTTGTPITPYGMSTLQTTSGTANNVTWTLADPTAAGLCKSIFSISTTTTTPVTLIVLFTAATGASSDLQTSTGVVGLTFSGYGGYVELQALSTSQWAIIGRSVGLFKST